MKLAIEGTVQQVLPVQSGESSRGTWRKREFIIETPGQYPKQVCLVQWSDDIDAMDLRPGMEVRAHIDLSSREYNGRWYTDAKAWKVELAGGGTPPPPSEPSEPQGGLTRPDDDLPF